MSNRRWPLFSSLLRGNGVLTLADVLLAELSFAIIALLGLAAVAKEATLVILPVLA
jgi:hypothetical protein